MRAFRLMMVVAVISIAPFGGNPCWADDTVSPQATPNPPPPIAAPPQAPAKSEAPAAAAPAPPSVTVIDAVDARGILGRDVKGAADEDMGHIVDVIVDRGGSVRGA